MEFIPDSLKLSGNLSVNNLDPDAGYPAGWSGGIHAQEIYTEGKIGIGSGGELKVSLNKDGDAYLAGKLGIGTGAPVSKLQVAGDITIEAMPGGVPPRSLPAKGTLIWNDGNWLRLNQNLDWSKPIFGVHTPGLFAPNSLNVGGAGGWGDPGAGNVWITGNVGIGTTNPAVKLHVAGNYLRVDGAGNEQVYIGGDGFGNDVQLGSFNPNVKNVAVWNEATKTRMTLFADDFIKASDLRNKKNIRLLSHALDKVMQLRGVVYEKQDEVQDAYGRNGSKIGLIAQEVNEVLPEVVSQDGKGFYGIAYTSVIPLLVEAIKEQQASIAELKKSVKREW